jgi:hypothetical protein
LNNQFTDLNNMVSQYEYWAHRLYPRMKFKDVIERLEKLGEKREIRVTDYFFIYLMN